MGRNLKKIYSGSCCEWSEIGRLRHMKVLIILYRLGKQNLEYLKLAIALHESAGLIMYEYVYIRTYTVLHTRYEASSQ
jgi:hypothetical protein